MEELLQVVNAQEMNELHRAVLRKQLDRVKYLIKDGADVTNTINNGQTPLHIAVGQNDHSATKELVGNKSGDELRRLINSRTVDTGSAVLHLAAKNNPLESVSFFLNRGANFQITNSNRQRPKLLTTDKVIKELLENIEEIFDMILKGDSHLLQNKLNFLSADNFSAIMYARDSNGRTSLQQAIQIGNLEALGDIIKCRLDKLKRDNYQYGEKPLDLLVQHSKAARRHLSNLDRFFHGNSGEISDACEAEIINLLQRTLDFLEACKGPDDVNLTNQYLVVIEESLEFFGSKEASKFVENGRINSLLRKGLITATKILKICLIAPMVLMMKKVYSCNLIQAAKNNKWSIVEQCLHRHPDLNKRCDEKGWTALHYAFRSSNYEMAKLLLEFGADPTVIGTGNKDYERTTPMHLAVGHSGKEPQKASDVIQLMFECLNERHWTRYINMSNGEKLRLLHFAVMRPQPELVEFLLSHGAIYCMKDIDGKQPKDHYSRGFGSSRGCYEYILHLLTNVHRSFACATNGQTEELLQIISNEASKSVETLLALVGARNAEGLTLLQVLDNKRHVDAADDIRKLVNNVKW